VEIRGIRNMHHWPRGHGPPFLSMSWSATCTSWNLLKSFKVSVNADCRANACIHTYIRTQMHADIHTYTYFHAYYANTHVLMPTETYSHADMFCTFKHIHKYMHNTYTITHVFIIHTCTYIHTHAYRHTCRDT